MTRDAWLLALLAAGCAAAILSALAAGPDLAVVPAQTRAVELRGCADRGEQPREASWFAANPPR